MCESTTEFHDIYHKTWNMILGCESKDQLQTARNYADNFYRVFSRHPEIKYVREDIENLFSRQNKIIH